MDRRSLGRTGLQVHGRVAGLAGGGEQDHILRGGPLDALRQLREQGKVRFIGVTCEEPWALLPFLQEPDVDMFQIGYNPLRAGGGAG